jgi:hypothetical protein
VRLTEVRGGRLTVDERLGKAELEQQVGALWPGKRLGVRAPQIGDRALGRPTTASAAGGIPQHGHDLVGGVRGLQRRRNQQQVRGNALRVRSGLCEQARGPRVQARSLERCQRLVDGSADERMDETERGLRPKHVDPREIGCRRRCLLLAQVGQRGRMVRVDVLTEDRDCLGKLRRLGRKAAEADRDGSPAGTGGELSQGRDAGLDRGDVVGH